MKKFARAYIEITNVCNLSCSFCIKNSRKPGFMSQEQFSYILDKISLYTNHIYLHVLGEPLLHPLLQNFLNIAFEKNIKVSITTNGTLLKEKEEILANAKALHKIGISLHSLETDDINIKNDYLLNVANFAKMITNKGVICELRLWNLGADVNNEDIFTPLCNFLGLTQEKKQSLFENIELTGNAKLCDKLFLAKDKRFNWPSLKAQPTNKPVFCYGLRNQIAILNDGTVVPCCLDSSGDINLGNIFSDCLEDILQSKRAKDIYNGFSKRMPSEELCKRCGYATRF